MNHEYPSFISHIKGQFILTAENRIAPEGWSVITKDAWKLFTSDLPVIDVMNVSNEWVGWCIGYPIVDGVFLPDKIILNNTFLNIEDSIEDFYCRSSGRWVLFHFESGRTYLDPFGSLATVYSQVERTIASTPTLIGSEDDWDKKFMNEIGFPEKIRWLPSGITLKKNVRRLVPNHCLDLKVWKEFRHWPTSNTVLSIEDDTTKAVSNIIDSANRTVEALSAVHPLSFTLTGGRDSRMVLACSRKYVEDANVLTFANGEENIDTQIAHSLAKKLDLKHAFISTKYASEIELNQWLYLTGFSVSGDIWKIHKTIEQLDPSKVLLPGTSAEVHKGNYWRPNDKIGNSISASEVLDRCKLPHHPIFLEATEKWLSEIQFLNLYNILDLVHIEQRLGCWAAIQPYGNTTSKIEIAIFNSRNVLHTMMRLPVPYRKKKQLVVDICKSEWPELLDFPFNEYTGLKGFVRSKAKKIKGIIKEFL